MKTKMKLLKTSQVATQCGVSPRTVAKWLRDGTLKGVKINGHTWRIDEEELKKFVKGLGVQPE